MSIKQLCIVLMLAFTLPAYGGGWEGGKVRVKEGALLCDFFNLERALILQKAGDEDSVQVLINKGFCLRVPNDFFAIVVKDASTFTNPDLAEIVLMGASAWGAMKDMECCYKEK
mgnify:CR=1 FL=1